MSRQRNWMDCDDAEDDLPFWGFVACILLSPLLVPLILLVGLVIFSGLFVYAAAEKIINLIKWGIGK